jgi:hypothetical protein
MFFYERELSMKLRYLSSKGLHFSPGSAAAAAILANPLLRRAGLLMLVLSLSFMVAEYGAPLLVPRTCAW